MTEDEHDEFARVILRVAARTRAVVFAEMDRDGAVQYALMPQDRMALEYAVLPRSPRRRRRRGAATLS